MIKNLMELPLSEYVKVVVLVPETHADLIREVMGKRGVGESDRYSYGSFSVKGISRFIPKKEAEPYIGEEGKLTVVVEERIETICKCERVEKVIDAIKKAHPYEETIIEIYPIYKIGFKQESDCFRP